jgi:putative acetyltransferase
MVDEAEIRTTIPGDQPDLNALYRAAFPDEDLLPLVDRLIADEPGILSLAATIGDQLVGHILFTPCGVGDGEGERHAALLGPLAVAPSRQRRGVGSALVRDGFNRLRQTALRRVLVLGDPNYYRRFGFLAEKSIVPPYDLPADWSEAWQSVKLEDGMETPAGILRPPAAWLSPSLWAP